MQILKPILVCHKESGLFRYELPLRKLVSPFNYDGITPEFVPSNNLDPNQSLHPVTLYHKDC